MDNIKISYSLKIDGDEAIKFIESLISVDPEENTSNHHFY